MIARGLALVIAALVLVGPAFAQELTGELAGGELGGLAPARILVIGDDLGTQWLDAYGASGAHIGPTPALDTIASAGARFERAVVNPSCGTTRASLLLGQWNIYHGAFGAIGLGWPEGRDSYLGNLIRARGVATAWTGKFQNEGGNQFAWWGANAYGFDAFHGFYGTQVASMFSWDRTESTRAEFRAAGPTWELPPAVFFEPTASYVDTETVDVLLAALAARDPRVPFFGVWSASNLHDVHDPTIPGSGISDCVGNPNLCRARMLTALDAEIGRLLAALDLDRDQLWLIGDNGGSGVPGAGKGTLFEGGTRVPLLIVGGSTPAGTVPDWVHAVDVHATLVDLYGGAYGGAEALQGYSFATLIGYPCGTPGRCWADRAPDIIVAQASGGARVHYSRTPEATLYKLHLNGATGAAAFYDLTTYPGFGNESGDLCGGDGTCAGDLDVPAAAAYVLHCGELAAADVPTAFGCPPLL